MARLYTAASTDAISGEISRSPPPQKKTSQDLIPRQQWASVLAATCQRSHVATRQRATMTPSLELLVGLSPLEFRSERWNGKSVVVSRCLFFTPLCETLLCCSCIRMCSLNRSCRLWHGVLLTFAV